MKLPLEEKIAIVAHDFDFEEVLADNDLELEDVVRLLYNRGLLNIDLYFDDIEGEDYD